MRLRQRPFNYLMALTAIAVLLAALPAFTIVRGVDASCISEWCDVPQTLAMIALSAVALLWLVVVVLISWWWHKRAPSVAAVSAIAGGLLLIALGACDMTLWLTPGSFDSPIFVIDQLVLVLAIGVQLPAIWRLAGRATPARIGVLAAVVTCLATLGALGAYVVLGPSLFDDGPNVQYVGYLAFCVGLAVAAIAAWRMASQERPGLALIAAGALFFFGVGAYNYIDPADGTSILLIAGPVMALGWLWVGIVWLRAARTGELATS